MKVHGQNGDCSKPKSNSWSFKAWNHKKGASMRPYALLASRHISSGRKFILVANSGTGSNPKILSLWGRPWRNAAFTSNDLKVHDLEAISCRSNIFECRLSVGESLGISVIFGSKYPNTTSLALAFWVLVGFCGSLSDSSIGFHVRTQRHRSTCSGAICLLNIRCTVPVFNQLVTSASLARWNSARSELESSDNRISDLWRLAADTRKASSSGRSLFLHWWMSSSVTNKSQRQPMFCSRSSKTLSSTSWQYKPSQTRSSSVSSGIGISSGTSGIGISWGTTPSESDNWLGMSSAGGVTGTSGSWSGWSSCPELLEAGTGSCGISDGTTTGLGRGALSVPGTVSRSTNRVIPPVTSAGNWRAISDAVGSPGLSTMVLASSVVTGRTCSGAHLKSLLDIVTQMVCWFSWTTTFIGPCQNPGDCPFPAFQTMTHSPAW